MMETKTQLRGMANVSYWAENVIEARHWYNLVFDSEPYFEKPDAEHPAYIEYRVGDYRHEVGIIDIKYRPKTAQDGVGGATLYWHVDDIEATMQRLLERGATALEPVTKRGEGFITASVTDPFGNVLGIMYNRHYLSIFEEGPHGDTETRD